MTEPFDRTAWARRSIRQMVALGVPFSDAAQATKWILDTAPEDADLDTWLPTPSQLDAAAQITDADIADARADWLIRPDNAGRWQFILDAVAEQEPVTEYGTASSGNWGHAGVKGQLGGSAPGGGGGGGQAASTGGAAIGKQPETLTFATRQEAEGYLGQFSSGPVSLRGMAPDTASQVSQAVSDTMGRMRVRPFSRITAKAIDSDAIASVNIMSDELTINTSVCGNAQKWAAYQAKVAEADAYVRERIRTGTVSDPRLKSAAERALSFDRQLVNVKDVRGAIVHEIGHHIDHTALMKDRALRQKVLDGRGEYVRKLSAYADKDAFEFVAESFSAYMAGEKESVMPELASFFEGLNK